MKRSKLEIALEVGAASKLRRVTIKLTIVGVHYVGGTAEDGKFYGMEKATIEDT